MKKYKCNLCGFSNEYDFNCACPVKGCNGFIVDVAVKLTSGAGGRIGCEVIDSASSAPLSQRKIMAAQVDEWIRRGGIALNTFNVVTALCDLGMITLPNNSAIASSSSTGTSHIRRPA